MKNYPPLVLVVLLLGTLSACQREPILQSSDHIAPGEIGINKFVFTLTAPPGSLVVFRAEESLDGRLIQRQETFTNIQHGSGATQQTVLICSAGSPGVATGIVMKAPGGRAYPAARFRSMGQNETRLEVELEDTVKSRTVMRRFVYTMFVEKYVDAKRREPTLPSDISTGWGYWTPQYNSPEYSGDNLRP